MKTLTAPQGAQRHLSVLTYANGFTLWHYKSLAHSLSAVCEPGYFDPTHDVIAVGDMVLVSAPDGGAQLCCIENEGSPRFLVMTSASVEPKPDRSAPCVLGGMADAVFAVAQEAA